MNILRSYKTDLKQYERVLMSVSVTVYVQQNLTIAL